MKYNDEKIKRYEELDATIKAMKKEFDALKKEFIQSNGGESDTYIITLEDNFREIVAGKADFEKKFGASWLKDNGMLKLSAFNTVVISRKIERKVG